MEIENNREPNRQARNERQNNNNNFDWNIDFNLYKKNFFRNLCWNMCVFIGLLVWIIIAGSGTWGGNSKSLVIAAIWIKFFFAIPMEVAYMGLIYKRMWRSTTIGLFKLLLRFIFLGWYIYITVAFFSSHNDCKKEERAIWVAHLILLIEAWFMFLFILFICCILTSAIVLIWYYQRKKKKEMRQANRIRDVLLNAVNLQLNLEDLNEDDSWAIWLEEFTENDKIIRLPWDQRHHFHSKCIGDWWARKTTCPLWKTAFNREMLKKVKKEELAPVNSEKYIEKNEPQNDSQPNENPVEISNNGSGANDNEDQDGIESSSNQNQEESPSNN